MIYGYIRVSTDKQTVQNQKFEIENFCKQNNLVVNHWINETISGTVKVQDRKFKGRGDNFILSLYPINKKKILMISSIYKIQL